MATQYYNANVYNRDTGEKGMWYYSGMDEAQAQAAANAGGGTYRQVEGDIPDYSGGLYPGAGEAMRPTYNNDYSGVITPITPITPSSSDPWDPLTPLSPGANAGTPYHGQKKTGSNGTIFMWDSGLNDWVPESEWGGGDIREPNFNDPNDPLSIGSNIPTNTYPIGSPEWWEMVQMERNPNNPDYSTGYMKALGLMGRQQLNPWEQYQANAYGDLSNLWGQGNTMAAMGYGGMKTDPFMANWGAQMAQDPSQMYGYARNMLNNVMGMTPDQRGQVGMMGGEGNFADVLRMGLQSTMGGAAASSLAKQVPILQQQYLAENPQSKGPSFIDYLRTKYNLDEWL
uniref:Uncharacterized protein n=1 Tax=viral metagenome TaxID=1070528 RepID=A0A6M3KLW5_9ZZZZ